MLLIIISFVSMVFCCELPDEIDVLVIGSGPAASVSAFRISEETSLTVVVLEKGPFSDPNEHKPSNWSHFTPIYVNYAGREIKYHQVQGLGGQTLHYGGLWIQPSESVFPVEPHREFFKRVESHFKCGESDYHGCDGRLSVKIEKERFPSIVEKFCDHPDYNDGKSTSSFCSLPQVAKSLKNGRPTIANSYLSNKTTICYNANVNKLLFQNQVFQGVELFDGRTIHAKNAILGAGHYHSPQILIRSGIGPAGKVSHNEEVGQYWNDEYALLLKWKVPDTPSTRFLKELSQNGSLPNQLHVMQFGNSTKQADIQVSLRAGSRDARDKYISEEMDRYGFDIRKGFLGVRISVYHQKNEKEGIGYVCGENRICVTEDPTDYQLSMIRKAVKSVQQEIVPYLEAKLGGGRLVPSNPTRRVLEGGLSDPEILDWVRRDATFALHGSGTTSAVLDGEMLKVKGVEGVSVVDASAFLRPLDANPAATLFALGEVFADRFIAQV